MGDSSFGARGCSDNKGRHSEDAGGGEIEIASFAIVQETGHGRRELEGDENRRRHNHHHHHHHHHSRTRSTGHSGSSLSLNSSSSFHKFCGHSSPVSTPKFGRHDFCISLGSSSSLNAPSHSGSANCSGGRMVRQGGGGSTSSGYLSKPNSPSPARRSALVRCDVHNNSDTSDNSSPTSHMSSSSGGSSGGGGGGGKGKKGASHVTVNGVGSGYGGDERRSVHKQNLYVVSFPIILLFNIFRSLLYQLFVLLRYVFVTAVQRRHYYAELKRQRQQEAVGQQQRRLQQVATGGTAGTAGGGEATDQLVETSTTAIATTTTTTTTTTDSEEPELIMNSPRVPVGPGPADPLLAKQKHHHRRAFEYISKALKIDEENEGECVTQCLCLAHLPKGCLSGDLPAKERKSRETKANSMESTL